MEAKLHDGTIIPVVTTGSGRPVLTPVRTERRTPAEAEELRKWGAEPDAGPDLIDDLARSFRVVAADYEEHRERHPAADTLTPDNVVRDLLAIADAAGADSFAYYGYSWLALSGLQLALATDRLWALVMGGYPPAGGPYAEMLAVTRTAHAMALAAAERPPAGPVPSAEVEPGDWDAVPMDRTPEQTGQYVTLYEALEGFDDTAAQRRLTVPRLAFAGDDDEIAYGPDWGGVTVRLAEPLRRHRAELEAAGWTVELLPGLDHMTAMHTAAVRPLVASFLAGAA
jgi:pimeloyl-ACP methyl ester carboxylesterase